MQKKKLNKKCELIRGFQSHNIVRYNQSFKEKDLLIIIMEFCPCKFNKWET